jgi:carbonyl reductase 1
MPEYGNLGAETDLSIEKQIENTIQINFKGTLNLFNELFHLFRENSRIINVTSDWGLIYYIENDSFRSRLLNRNLSIKEIQDLIEEYLQ